MKALFFISIVLLGNSLLAQQRVGTIKGKITLETGEAAIGTAIVLQETNLGAVVNLSGTYEIKHVPSGTYNLLISAVGYKQVTQTITLKPGETVIFNQTISEKTLELDELVVYGKSEATQLREQAYAIEVVETKGFKNLSINANDILSKISGVNIRQSGGLGSAFSLTLNGLSDNQVRVFLDGVPMDYFGTSLSLNNFSANLIDRIEVYKGVVPIHLSSDALGGAINVVTNKEMGSYLDASYSIGSFGTHIASLNTQYRSAKSGFTLRLKSFYNESDNNYKVPIKLVNFDTGQEDDFETEVERFHDAYEAKMAWVEAGVTGTKYADQLMFGFMYSDNYKEIQQPEAAIGQAKIPYGEVATLEEKAIVNLNYSKTGMLNERLSANAYLVGVFSDNIFRDTSSYQYDWQGGRELKNDDFNGEIELRKTLLMLEGTNYLGNINTEFEISTHHNIAANYSFNYLEIQGSDDFKSQNNTQFKDPSKVTKQVLGIGYTNTFLDKNLKNTLFAKFYNYGISSVETNFSGTEENVFSQNKERVGFGLSTTYQFNKIQAKASFESAIRFPESIELFGDGLNFVSNPSLKPERSRNYNLGLIYNNLSAANPVNISLNGFVRDAEDFIIPQIQALKVFHINSNRVLSKGIDLAGSYSFDQHIIFTINGTYLDLRDNSKWRNGAVGTENSQYKIRIPNVPYLFGNLTASYRGEGLLKKP